MARLNDFAITNFDGGLVVDKSNLELDRNEFVNTLNYDLDERGRLKTRLGSQQFGDTKSGILDNSFYFQRVTGGDFKQSYHLLIDRASNGTLYQIKGNYLETAITTSSTTLETSDGDSFTSSGNVEIEGDIIAYTGKTGDDLTTASGIRVAHPAFSRVNQIVSLGATGLDTRSGAYFAVLNNIVYICGNNGGVTFDGSSITAVSDAQEPNGLFATNYRQRIYVAGAKDASGNNDDPRRVSFSDAGDSTSWDANNFFDVEDDRGESVSGQIELNDNFLIFKHNSIFTYDEVQLKQRLWNVGAWNNRVVQKINKLVYTFCPTGIYVTNGFSAEKISDPVRSYIENFHPQWSADTFLRIVDNCFAGQYRDKYYLYIDNTLTPSLSDVVLVYDTIRKNWTVHDTYTNFRHFGSLSGFGQGPLGSNAGDAFPEFTESLFAGDTGGKYFKLFDNRFIDNESTKTIRGGDIIPNLISDNAGSAVSASAETQYYTLGSVRNKKVKFIRVLVEQGEFDISYSLDKGDRKTDFKPLGSFRGSNIRVRFGHQGYAIAFRINSKSIATKAILNSIILEEIETIDVN